MREEIEAAVTFLTRLLATKSNPDPGGSGGSAVNSGTSNDSKISTQDSHQTSTATTTTNNSQQLNEEKIKKFSQKLIEILTQRFQNHWYPNNPSKGQGYRCIRINQNCRVDYSIEMACQHAGISYDALRLPVELTLWIDPSEVTCRFGENKGSYCIVAKLGDGRKENFVDSINIDELEQRSIEHRSKTAFENSSRMKMKSLSHLAQHQRHLASMAVGNHLAVAAHLAGSAGVSSTKQQNRQQSPAASLMNQFISTTSASFVNNSVASYHAMNGNGGAGVANGALAAAGSTPNSHHGIGASPVGGAASLTNGFSGVDHHAYASALGATVNGLGPVFGPVSTGGPGSGSASAGPLFPGAAGATGSQTTNQQPGGPAGAPPGPFQPYQSAAQYFFHQQQHVNFQQQQQQQQMAAAAAIQHQGSWSPASGLFGAANSASKFLTGMTGGGAGSPQQQAHPASSSTPPTTSVIGQSRAASLGGVVSSLTSGGFGTNRVQTSSSATTPTNVAVKSNSQTNSNAAGLLTNGGLMSGNGANSNPVGSNSVTANGANPNAPVFVPRANYLYSQFNLSAQPFTPSSLANSFGIESTNGSPSSTATSMKDRRTGSSSVSPGIGQTSSSSTSSTVTGGGVSVAATAATATTAGTPLVLR
ncbi:uncharacterized protein LOC124489955 isoform X2 [Dermatophagoides farinae]|uniref:uncharacterized protein LOC124489955 isoform X2 n=1 Tax=Dermatophagoides farinae TaxID=6954 RepID=UPI003F61162F